MYSILAVIDLFCGYSNNRSPFVVGVLDKYDAEWGHFDVLVSKTLIYLLIEKIFWRGQGVEDNRKMSLCSECI